jgi:aminopeptidase N
MENWGLITCRETGLIVDPNDTTQEQKQKIATLIAHEISHQANIRTFFSSVVN